MEIVKATKDHLAEIVEIYNWAVVNTQATFDTKTKTPEDQHIWLEKHKGDYVLLVALEDKKVVGWAGVAPWSDRCAYDGTGEVAIYIHPHFHNQGLGTKLLKSLIKWGCQKEFRTLISKIISTSEHSLALHRKLGFQDIGVMKNVGKKFDQFLDVELLQYLY